MLQYNFLEDLKCLFYFQEITVDPAKQARVTPAEFASMQMFVKTRFDTVGAAAAATWSVLSRPGYPRPRAHAH